MDNTALTILGMIAAFVTASVTSFLAEPIKSYFAERAKLNSLRLALYKEIAQNSLFLDPFIVSLYGNSVNTLLEFSILGSWVSDKCYKNIIEHSVEEYYRLDDLVIIDHLYKWIKLILLTTENSEEVFGLTAMNYGTTYIKDVSDSLRIGKLSQKAMKKAVGKEILNKLLNPEITTKKSPPLAKEMEQKRNDNLVVP